MVTRTELGTAVAEKSSSDNIVLADAAVSIDDCIIVGVAGQGANFPTSVTWGNRNLARTRRRAHATPAFNASIWTARRVQNTDTRDITATWASANSARAILAIKLDAPHVRNGAIGNIQTGSTAPTATAAPAPTVADSVAWGILVSEGPATNDTAPTLQNSFTAGQRVGTNGAPPASNITMLEGFKIITGDIGQQTLTGTGATSRDWISLCVMYREILSITWDKNGDEIMVGDFVVYKGNEREVLALRFQRNTVELSTDGRVSSTETEVIR